MSLRISRLPWASKPKHESGVWYRVLSADGQFIGTVRGEGNATLLQNAPRLLAGTGAQLLAAETAGEAEIVLDPRRSPGLPAGSAGASG